MQIVDKHHDRGTNPRHSSCVDTFELDDSPLTLKESLRVCKVVEQCLVATLFDNDKRGFVMAKSPLPLPLVNTEVRTTLLEVLLAWEQLLNPFLDLGLTSGSLSFEDIGIDSSFVRVDEPFEEVLQTGSIA